MGLMSKLKEWKYYVIGGGSLLTLVTGWYLLWPKEQTVVEQLQENHDLVMGAGAITLCSGLLWYFRDNVFGKPEEANAIARAAAVVVGQDANDLDKNGLSFTGKFFIFLLFLAIGTAIYFALNKGGKEDEYDIEEGFGMTQGITGATPRSGYTRSGSGMPRSGYSKSGRSGYSRSRVSNSRSGYSRTPRSGASRSAFSRVSRLSTTVRSKSRLSRSGMSRSGASRSGASRSGYTRTGRQGVSRTPATYTKCNNLMVPGQKAKNRSSSGDEFRTLGPNCSASEQKPSGF